jgi:hypothetical protein
LSASTWINSADACAAPNAINATANANDAWRRIMVALEFLDLGGDADDYTNCADPQTPFIVVKLNMPVN